MKDTTLWIASGNPAKANELHFLTKKTFPHFLMIHHQAPQNVVEDEPSFLGNAKKKAYALARELLAFGETSFAVLGDDSGLAVDLLNGGPGVYSARYAGLPSSPQKNLEKLLDALSMENDLQKRTAAYHCSLCLVVAVDGKIIDEHVAEGKLIGLIGFKSEGSEGYAYDSIFLHPETLRSYAAISFEEKQRDSHRTRAFHQLKNKIENA